MPRRKSRSGGSASTRSLSHSVPREGEASYRAPQLTAQSADKCYSLARISPGRSGAASNPIETVELTREEALSLAEKGADKVHLVAEAFFEPAGDDGKGNTRERFVEGPAAKAFDVHVPLNEMLLAMGCVPEGHVALSRSAGRERVLEELRSDFDEMSAMGAVCDIDKISLVGKGGFLGKEDALTMQGAYMERSDSSFEYPVIYQGLGVADDAKDWINSRFIAAELLNCCYIGRGAPTGVDLLWQVNEMASAPDAMRDLLCAATNGLLEVPDIAMDRLPEWRESLLWRSRLSSYAVVAMKRTENFRTRFRLCPYVYYDEQMLGTAKAFQGIRRILVSVLERYERGKDNNVPDIIWQDGGAKRLEQVLYDLGATAMIDAFLYGCDIDDVLA